MHKPISTSTLPNSRRSPSSLPPPAIRPSGPEAHLPLVRRRLPVVSSATSSARIAPTAESPPSIAAPVSTSDCIAGLPKPPRRRATLPELLPADVEIRQIRISASSPGAAAVQILLPHLSGLPRLASPSRLHPVQPSRSTDAVSFASSADCGLLRQLWPPPPDCGSPASKPTPTSSRSGQDPFRVASLPLFFPCSIPCSRSLCWGYIAETPSPVLRASGGSPPVPDCVRFRLITGGEFSLHGSQASQIAQISEHKSNIANPLSLMFVQDDSMYAWNW